ncbi:MAG: TauD/TfdA family dioxygenase [Magnetospirillum sp.]|jgi:taurine dioxygenase|nr:TauD/TfdA family dioxygenase [Magnetospirillum sp.]
MTHAQTLAKTTADAGAGLRVETVVDGFVARIRGIDITAMDDTIFAAIYRKFLDTPVLVFPDQPKDAAAFFAFTNRFGQVVEHVLNQFHHPSVWGVSFITNVRPDGAPDPVGYKRSREWHTDRSYDTSPGKTTALLALEMPEIGGKTDFADMYAAYAALPDDLRVALAGKVGIFRWSGRKAEGSVNLTPDQSARLVDATHPILQLHPESGRPTVYVDPGNLIGIVGMTQAESEPILQRLFAHCLQPAFHYAHKWTVGELVIWDNRCSMHRAAGGYAPTERRVLIRTQTQSR